LHDGYILGYSHGYAAASVHPQVAPS